MTKLDRLRAQLAAVDSAIEALDQARELQPDDEMRWVASDARRWRARITARLAQAEREAMNDVEANNSGEGRQPAPERQG